MKIEIPSTEVKSRGGIIKDGPRKGEKYNIRWQEAYMYNGHAHPERFDLTLDDDQSPYAIGFHTISDDSYEVGDFNRPQFARRIKLEPYVEAAVRPVRAAQA